MATTTRQSAHHTQHGKDDGKSEHAKSNDHEPKQSRRKDQLATSIGDIREAVATKYNQVFMLTDDSGNFSPENAGFGLYFRDTQYLDHWELTICGQHPVSLLSDSSRGTEARMELTNPKLTLRSGETVDKERLSLKRTQTLHHHITDTVSIRNMRQVPIELDVTLSYGSNFTDMFEVRGHTPGKRGTLNAPTVKGRTVDLSYAGADGHRRSVTITFSEPPDALDGYAATYHLKLKPRTSQELTFSLALADEGPNAEHDAEAAFSPRSGSDQHQSFDKALRDMPDVRVNNALFERALARSFDDIRMLATANGGDIYVSAGVPWYVALFGRDSCIAAFEMLAFQPHLARMTLEVLARYQGTKDDDFQDEEPGKIPHELRLGEMANLHEVPMIPYYGSVDSTPWFLMLMAEYCRWTGDVEIFKRLEDNVNRALDWVDSNPTRHRKQKYGFLRYGTRSQQGLANQGWKDSGNSIVNADGSLCKPPIALVEVQGYVYRAKLGIAQIYRHLGDAHRAQELEEQAQDLKQRFNQAYWMRDKNFYALCLEQDDKQAQVISSNPGQALFGGVVDDDKAQAVCDGLMSEPMYSGWGIRTLSAEAAAYNPLDYQVGAVWPHDNALIAVGLWHYNLMEAVERVFTGIYDAATEFRHFRLPEVFDGFSREQYERPVHYPVACSPQAWAAGAIPLLLTTAMGLEPNAFTHTLKIRRPHLPPFLHHVTIEGLKVGQASVDLLYQREDNNTLVAVTKREGAIDVLIEY